MVNLGARMLCTPLTGRAWPAGQKTAAARKVLSALRGRGRGFSLCGDARDERECVNVIFLEETRVSVKL